MSLLPSLNRMNPDVGPNSAPHQDQIFSAHLSIHNAFLIHPDMSTNQLFTPINRISLKDTSLMVGECLVCSMESTTFTPTTSLVLCRKSCCFKSKIICICMYCQPSFLSNLVLGGYNWNVPSLSNAVISLTMVSTYKLFPFFLYKRSASLELLGILYKSFSRYFFTFLCLFLEIFALRDLSILNLFSNAYFLALLVLSGPAHPIRPI